MELPVSNLLVMGVTGTRSKRISKQAYIEIEIEGKQLLVNFLVVSWSNLDFIIGCDFLEENKAKLDFENKLIKFKIENSEITTNFINKKKSMYTGMCSLKLCKENDNNVFEQSDVFNNVEAQMDDTVYSFYNETLHVNYDFENLNDNFELEWETKLNEVIEGKNLVNQELVG